MAPLFTANWFNFGKTPDTGDDTVYITATGGNATGTYGGKGDKWKFHTFTGSGSMVVPTKSSDPTLNYFEYLVIAGGGGGSTGGGGGGGGAGGLRTNFPGTPRSNPSTTNFPIDAGNTYPVVVGSGGEGSPTGTDTYGESGSVSSLNDPTNSPQNIESAGGGRGRSTPNDGDSWNGGSGGGGYGTGGDQEEGSGNTPSVSPPQGNPGGEGNTAPGYLGGGGGGAGGEGGDGGSEGTGGSGGAGLQVLIAGPTSPGAGSPAGYFAGGGGGGGETGSKPGGGGGTGGGGGGGPNGSNGTSAQANSGGGGGGGSVTGAGGDGGSGIVIVRYRVG